MRKALVLIIEGFWLLFWFGFWTDRAEWVGFGVWVFLTLIWLVVRRTVYAAIVVVLRSIGIGWGTGPGLAQEVINRFDGKKYTISTAPNPPVGVWETAVFEGAF